MSGVPYGDTVAIDTNTTYSVGDGGLTQNNFTTTLKNKLDNIEDPDVSIGRISLSENNFTDTLKGKLDDIADNANNYSLPTADAGTKGGVKVGGNLTIDGGGTLNLPTASDSALGGVKVGGGLTIDGSSVLHVTPSKAYATLQMPADSPNTYNANLFVRFLDNLPSNGANTPGTDITKVVSVPSNLAVNTGSFRGFDIQRDGDYNISYSIACFAITNFKSAKVWCVRRRSGVANDISLATSTFRDVDNDEVRFTTFSGACMHARNACAHAN